MNTVNVINFCGLIILLKKILIKIDGNNPGDNKCGYCAIVHYCWLACAYWD